MRAVAVLALLALASPARANDALFPPATKPSLERCEDGMYLTPSAFASSVAGRYMTRLALGLIRRQCNAARTRAVHYRLGFSAYVADEDAGFGGELEVAVPIVALDDVRLGGRVSAENAWRWGAVFTAGARLHLSDTFFVGVDVFTITDSKPTMFDRTAPFGAAAGVGFEGTAGALLGGALLVLTAVVALGSVST